MSKAVAVKDAKNSAAPRRTRACLLLQRRGDIDKSVLQFPSSQNLWAGKTCNPGKGEACFERGWHGMGQLRLRGVEGGERSIYLKNNLGKRLCHKTVKRKILKCMCRILSCIRS